MEIVIKEEFKMRKEELLEKIRGGAIFIHPTDTIYGIGCSALYSAAIKKIREIKQRYQYPFSVIAPSKKWILDNCLVNSMEKEWIEKLPGPYTLILKLKNQKAVSSDVFNGLDTIGIRIPGHWFSEFVAELGIPIITTSVNISGEEYMTSIEDLNPTIKSKMSFVIYEGEKSGRPSTIIDLTKNKESIIQR